MNLVAGRSAVVIASMLVVFSASGGLAVNQYTLPQRMSQPVAIVFTDDGQGWIATWEAGIVRLDPNGTLSKVAQSSREYRFMVIGPDGAVWIARAHDLWRIDPASGAIVPFGTGDYIDALATGRDGALWLLRRDSAMVFRIIRMDSSGAVISTAITNLPIVDGGRGGVVAADEALWTLYGKSVIRIDAAGRTSTVPLPFWPYWIFAARDFVWILGDDQHSVAKVSVTEGVVAKYWVETAIGGATVDAYDNLWIVDERTERILRLSPEGEETRYGSLTNPPVDPRCEYVLPVPMTTTPDGRLALVRSYWEDNNFPPYGQCRADARAVDTLLLIDPDHEADHAVPTLSATALSATVLFAAAAALWRLRG